MHQVVLQPGSELEADSTPTLEIEVLGENVTGALPVNAWTGRTIGKDIAGISSIIAFVSLIVIAFAIGDRNLRLTFELMSVVLLLTAPFLTAGVAFEIFAPFYTGTHPKKIFRACFTHNGEQPLTFSLKSFPKSSSFNEGNGIYGSRAKTHCSNLPIYSIQRLPRHRLRVLLRGKDVDFLRKDFVIQSTQAEIAWICERLYSWKAITVEDTAYAEWLHSGADT